MTINILHRPVVSVRLMTYNQEDYISQAIESVVMQQTQFDYEIIIGDDFSTDKTPEIANRYQTQYPHKIRVLYRKKHLGRLNNFSDILSNCRGKYVALLDGDDYWTDPHKLQKQVDFLEAHPDYVVCHHDAIIVDEHGNTIQSSKLPDHAKRDFSADELTKGAWLLTLTVCFRNLLHEYPPEFMKVVNGDSFLFSLLGQFGKTKYLGNIITPDVYRVHSGGVWSSLNALESDSNSLKTYYWLSKYYQRLDKKEYAEYFTRAYQSTLLKILKEAITTRNTKYILRTTRELVSKRENLSHISFIYRFILSAVTALRKRWSHNAITHTN